MKFLTWLMIGSVVGWIANVISCADREQGKLFNVLAGIVGSLLGGFIAVQTFTFGIIIKNSLSGLGLLGSLSGAIILLMIVKFLRRGSSP